MRTLCLILCLSSFCGKLAADPLSAADREALLENLEKLRGTVTGRVDARFRAAIAAYRSAMSDEKAVMELYLKCVKKLDFDDKHRKASEFNEWRKKQEDHLNDPATRRALMYQLYWLVLTLQAASDKADLSKLAAPAQQVVDDLFGDVATLTSQRDVLGQNVTSTVFARAYEIEGVSVEKWPFAPLNLEQVYDSVLLPPSRTSGNIAALRAGWLKRLRQEAVVFEDVHAKSKSNGRPLSPDTGHSQEQEKFLTETLPDLQWQMETDLFRCGDQRAAALRMLSHIEKHLTHRNACKWSDELKKLLTPVQASTPATEAVDTDTPARQRSAE
ncbi:MAG: hypothetical protein DVB26_01010 [Verrucomicrobia bacterium]|nr:MAG: hypothetical protein DVB26_01010 [Verrucomicrobiota bacterium]